ncbi:MAG: alpha/beta fold hydrolase [Acidobacteria bacterium]|nr:alpha/beta fold hydrolase [Acidobacteriota bacterium]MBI3663728.1 alpha/beta fold hydrolase [Acidobacteriota bacterium]
MKRREWFFAAAGFLLLALSTLSLFNGRIPAREVVFPQACGTPVRIMDPGIPGNEATAVVFHGLGANAVIMRSLGQSLAGLGLRVYLFDLPGHGNNPDSFFFHRAENCAAQVIALMDRVGEIRLDNTVLVGHSMGGALAVRMADYFPTAATIAISPAPMLRAERTPAGAVLMGPPRRMPVNLLILMGQFDFPYSRESSAKLVQMAGGERSQPGDFRQKRALKLETIPRATHTSLIFDLPAESPIVSWLQASLPGKLTPTLASSIKPESWGLFGLLGLMLLFPLTASGVARAVGLRDAQLPVASASTRNAILCCFIAGLFAVSVLNFVPQLSFLRMVYGGYLASCLLLAGVVLVLLLRSIPATRNATRQPHPKWRGVLTGALLGMATMLVFGAWMNLHLSDTWLNAPRWLRFFPAVLACLPYALAEEWALGAPGAGNWLAKTRRYILFAALRLLIWLSILFALYVYGSGQILLSVLVVFMGAFSLLTRLGADAVRRRTDSPAGTAVFTAILMAWFIAAVFPLA